MSIQTVEAQESGFRVTTDKGITMSVPDTMDNRHRVMIEEWVRKGGNIDPYVKPPPPPVDLTSNKELDRRLKILEAR